MNTTTEQLRATVREGYQVLLRAEAEIILPDGKDVIGNYSNTEAFEILKLPDVTQIGKNVDLGDSVFYGVSEILVRESRAAGFREGAASPQNPPLAVLPPSR